MYTYENACNGIAPEPFDSFIVQGLTYDIFGSPESYYLHSQKSLNGEIFDKLGLTNNEFFESVLGKGNFKAVDSARISPYAYSLDDMRKIIKKLWETPLYKVGTRIKIKDCIKSSDNNDFGFFLNDKMRKYANEYGIISKAYAHKENKLGPKNGDYICYCIQFDNPELNKDSWSWSSDMFDAIADEEKDTKPYKTSLAYLDIQPAELRCEIPVTKEECLEFEMKVVKVKLPKHKKQLIVL